MTRYYPIMLKITDKRCIVVGGGSVAYRKICSLLEYDAKITVISDKLCEKLQKIKDQNKIEWVSRNYQEGDLQGASLVFAATDNIAVNEQVYKEAQKRDIPANIVDIPDLCDFIVPSKIEQGDLTIAISTNGKSGKIF